jgi:organic radical activating enzyme
MKYSRVYIEISNICNLQCDFCPEVEREKKIMSLGLFQTIIDQLVGLTEEVTFHLMGEPLAHQQFDEFIDYCELKAMPVNITTNGTLLNHKGRAEKLLSPIVRQVNFSLQSLTSNFGQGNLEKYLQPIFSFTQQAFLRRPDLYINYRLWNMGSPEDTLSGNEHFLKPIETTFDVNVRRNIDVAFKKSVLLKNRLYLHFDSRFDWPTLRATEGRKQGYCYGLKTHFGIHADGTVVPCCLDKEAKLALGRVSLDDSRTSASVTSFDAVTVLQAIKSQRAQNIQQGFAQFQLREELCQKCTFIQRFDSKIKSLEVKSAKQKSNLHPHHLSIP